jgi:hypothetical protein
MLGIAIASGVEAAIPRLVVTVVGARVADLGVVDEVVDDGGPYSRPAAATEGCGGWC